MEQKETQASQPLGSNNPFRQDAPSSGPAMAAGQHRSTDSEKQVISSEMSSGPDNAPMPVTVDRDDLAPTPVDQPVHEADKEVVSSWQTQSRDQSAPISMAYHESNPQPQGDLLDDIKGPPPAYDASDRPQQSRESSDGLVSPTVIQPDGASSVLPARPEDRSAVGQLLSWIPPQPRRHISQMPPLAQPIIIPQLDIAPEGESVPFARCYSEALASHDVPMSDFLAFIDGLSLAQAPNSALQGLKMFGVGARQVPIPFIPLAGRGISKLATSGSGHSGSRSRLYLERAKKEYFAPRGLSMIVVRDGDLSARLGIPTHASRLAPLTKNSLAETCCRRRLGGLAPYVAPLKFNVPEQEAQLQGVHKMARKHLEGQMRQKAKTVTKLRERQWDDIARLGSQAREWEEQYLFKYGQLRRLQDDIVDEQKTGGVEKSGAMKEKIHAIEELQRELQMLETQRYMSVQNVAGRGVEAEMEEINLCARLKWIVIENLQG